MVHQCLRIDVAVIVVVTIACFRSTPVNGQNATEEKPPKCPLKKDPDLEALTFKLFSAVGGVFLPIICFVGMAGNLINIAVLTRPRMHCYTALLLQGLAVSHFCILFIYVMMSLHFFAYHSDPPIVAPPYFTKTETLFWWYFFHTWWIAANPFLTFSNWLVLVASSLRVQVVCFPKIAKSFLSVVRVRACIVALCVASVVLSIPEFQFLTVGTINGARYSNYSGLVDPDTYPPAKVTLNVFIPCLLCLTFSVVLVVKSVDKSSDLSAALGDPLITKEKGLGPMMIVISVLFLVCQLPSGISFIVSKAGTQPQGARALIFRIFSDLLLILYCTLNFFVYVLTNKTFRCVLREMVRKSGKATEVAQNAVPMTAAPEPVADDMSTSTAVTVAGTEEPHSIQQSATPSTGSPVKELQDAPFSPVQDQDSVV